MRLLSTLVPALAGAFLVWLTIPACGSSFMGTLGFQDDVDLVTSPDGEILVLCEAGTPGGPGRLRIIDLDAATGNPLAVALIRDLPGFEHAVDPLVVNAPGIPGEVVLVPYDAPDGQTAGVLVLNVSTAGAVLAGREVDIPLGDLGFRPDVDAFVAPYPTEVAFLALESRDHAVRGVLAVDLDPADAGVDGLNAFGSSLLLSTDGRLRGTASALVDWLPGLAEAVDPIGYAMSDRVRFLLPVVSGFDRPDLLRIDFDGSSEPPSFLGHASVRALNAAGPRPTDIPGFERDVDMILLDGPTACDLGSRSVLVPVEGPGDVADLYRLDEDGHAVWTFSHDSGTTLRLPGYPIGVDPLLMCGLGGAAPGRVALAVQTAAGNADFWILSLGSGALMARAENPAVNPGLTVPGFEIGVDPLRWTVDYLALPVERADHVGGLLIFDNLGVLQSSLYFPAGLGYVRSVDPIVAALPDPDRSLWVPAGKDDGGDANLFIFRAPPNLGLAASDVEALNAGLTVGGLVYDVDPGFVDKQQPGQGFLYVPEQNTAGVARLRFEPTPSNGRHCVLLCDRLSVSGSPPPSFYFFRVATGLVAQQAHDLLGLATGLDMAHGRGTAMPGNPPAQPNVAGTDEDEDPTLAWLPAGVSAVPRPEPPPSSVAAVRHANPFTPGSRILVTLVQAAELDISIVDAAGRLVRHVERGDFPAGEHAVAWDGRTDAGAPVSSGFYFLQVRDERNGLRSSKLIVLP